MTRSLSASLPITPPHPPSSSTRKHTWSSGGGVSAFRRRPGPGRSPVAMGAGNSPTTSGVAPRATRSSAKLSPGSSPTPPVPPARSRSESGLKAMTLDAQVPEEEVKEKEKKLRLLPLHQALQNSVNLSQGT